MQIKLSFLTSISFFPCAYLLPHRIVMEKTCWKYKNLVYIPISQTNMNLHVCVFLKWAPRWFKGNNYVNWLTLQPIKSMYPGKPLHFHQTKVDYFTLTSFKLRKCTFKNVAMLKKLITTKCLSNTYIYELFLRLNNNLYKIFS